MVIATPTSLQNVFVEENFSEVIEITYTANTTGNYVTDVVPSLEFPDISIAYDTDTVFISGYYHIDVFDETTVKHITRGSSDKWETPVTESGFPDDPNERQVFHFTPDSRNQIIVSYTIETTDGNVVVSQTVFNNYSIGRDLLGDYI